VRTDIFSLVAHPHGLRWLRHCLTELQNTPLQR
jgi:hypothetical protein